MTKARFLSGTYILQKNVHTFSQHREDPTCKLCKQQEEDICHMLLYCPLLREERKEPYRILKNTVIDHIGSATWKQFFSTSEKLLQLIIDCTRFSHMLSDEVLYRVERLTKSVLQTSHKTCYKFKL